MKKIKKTIATVAAVATSAVTVVAAGGVINKAWDYAGLSYSVEASPVLNAGYSIVRFYYQTGGNQRPDTLYAAAKEYVESLYPDCDVQGPYSQSGPALPDADETLEFWFLAYDANTSTDPEAEGLVKEDVVADTGLEVTPAEETLEVGENFQIIATKNLVFTKNVDYIVVSGSADSSGSSVGSTRYTNQESAAGILSYQSADDSIATVNAEGYVTAQGVGTTTITVTSTAPVGLASGTYTLNTVNGGSSATNNITVGEPSTLTTTVNVTVTGIPEVHPTDVTMDTPSVTLNGEIDTVTASGTESLTVGEEGTSSGSVSVKYGQSAELTASVSPEGAGQTVTWSSSDPSVATVSDGVVTAVKAGTATVTATSAADDTKKATSSITVTEPSKDVTWSSSDPSIVEVDSATGDTTAKAIGTATITATSVADSSKSDSYTVTVAAAPDDTVYPNGISLDSDNYEVEVGGTKQASVAFDPANTTDKSVTWEITSGTEFASVDADGLIHGLKKGEATLKATAVSKDADGKEVSATAKVTVTDPDEGRYTVTFVTDHATAPDAVRINAGEKVTNPGSLAEEGFIFLGWYTDSNHTTAVDWDAPINENKTYYAGWDRETPERITVVFDGNGGTIGGQSSTSEDVEIVDGNATITGLAPAAERDGYTLTGWNSSADGTGVNIGDVIANAQDKATYTFYAQWEEVYNGPTDFGIDFGTSGGSVKVGESIQLGTKNWSPDGLPAESKEVTWSVANGTGSATIDETGKLTGTAVGTVEVTAASKINPELTRTATVNVLPADAELIEPTDVDITDPSIGVSLDNITLQEGETKQLDAVITPADANTNTGKTWSIADPSVATVDQNGNVTGVKYGTTTVTVTLDNGVQDTATVTVTPVNPTDFGIDFGTSGGSVKVGESIQLGTKNWSPDGLPAESKEVTWSVANGTGSATIDETGKLTGTTVGTVEVTATSKINPELARTATVNVLPADAELIEPSDVDITDPSTGVSLDDITLQEGETKQLDAVITPADANTNTGKTWSIADPSVATVDQNGNVTGVKYGTTTVTVTLDNGIQDTATVTVTPVNPTDFGIDFGTSGGSVKVGESIQLGTKNWSPDGLPAESKEVTWSVANGTGSATIDETGKLTGTAVGTVEVTAASKINPELTRTATVNVLPADAELIEPTDVDITDPSTGVSLDDITLQEGETKQLDAVITPADANTNTGKTWSTADPSVATVDQNGNVTGIKYGTTTVTVTLDNGVQDTATVTVTPVNPTDFGIDFGTSGGSVKVGESIQLGTKNWSPDDLPAESKEVTWSVANGTGSATIDQTGKLTGTAVGTVEVTAASKINPELTRTATVNVLPADAELIEPTDVDITDPSTGVSLDDITLQEGETKQLDAVITPADANTNTGKTWSIADPSVATVDQNGKVTAIKAGTTTVTVILDNGVRDTAAVTVTPKPVENTDVEPTGTDIVDPFTGVSINDIELQEGTTRALDAVITPSNANVHTKKSWSIADTSIATVDQNGNVTGIKAGVTTVTVALENGVKDTATVRVTAKPTENTDIEPTGVSIGTKDVYLYVGNTKTLTATITPANANVHTNKTWSIANSAIAVIDQNGTVTGVKAGTTTVRVTLANGVSDTATVHVLDVSTPSYTVTFNGNGGVINGNSTATATADGAYTLYSNSFPTATRSGYNFSGWNTSANGTGTWVSAPYTFKANTTLYAQWSAATVAPTSVDISVPVITANPNGTVNTTYVSADSMSLKVGETKPIKATVLPANATDKSVTYSIADPSIARIDQNGNITGLRAGVTTATVRTVNGLTDAITVTVTPNSSMPNLYIEDIKSEYPAGKAIPVALNILDPDRGERLYVYYQIDNETPVLADTITATGNWQDVEVELPSNIAIGKHSFSFFVRDAAGNRSDDNGYAYIYNGDAYITDVDKYNPNRYDPSTWGTRFKADVTNTAPTLSLAAKLQDKVRIGDQLPANLTVKDENVGQKVTIYYQIDSGNPVEAGSFVSDGNAKNISVNVPTAGISEGDHVVTFYAVDEAGMKSNANGNVNAWNALGTNAGANQQTVTFTKGDGTGNTNGGNAPIVDIFKASGYKTTEDVAVTISVLEKDAGQKVTTYYSLDNGPETVIKSFKSTGRANTQQLNLGKLSEGTHTLEVWAIDEDGNRSDAADGLYTFSVSKASDGTVTVVPQPTVYNTSTIKTGVEAKASKAGIAAAVIGAAAAIGTVLKKKRK